MFTKTIQHIERLLTNDAVDRVARATKFVVGGGTVMYGSWYGLDYTTCGAPSTACFLFAATATLLGLTAFALLSEGGGGVDGG